MSGRGDSNFENDFKNKDGYLEDIHLWEDVEIKPFITHLRRYKRNLLTNAGKSFIVLETQSLIDCLEADEEYIVSAGRDHNIDVWVEDGCEGSYVGRLSGHQAPVTGLSLFNSVHLTSDKIIVSSSEDGSIRTWSLQKGEELHKIETGNVITCMGIMTKSLAIIGNHKGYMEVYHLRSGELYTSIRAHWDPVDALKVEGTYACTATFEAPSCLKVWDIQFEQTRCIYRIENSPDIEFCCLAIWKTKVILGASTQQKLFIIDFEGDHVESVDLERPGGKVQTVKVWNEWIISCSVHKTAVLLDVHRFHHCEHFGTFVSDVQQVRAIAAVELDKSFKIVIGGSALALMRFDFILTEEDNISFNSFLIATEKANFIQKEDVSSSTMSLHRVLDGFLEENLTDSEDDDSENETFPKCDEKVDYELHFDDIHFVKGDEIEHTLSPTEIQTELSNYYESKASTTPQSNFNGCHHVNSSNVSVKSESNTPPRRKQMLSILTVVKRESCMSPDRGTISPTQNITEPRVAIRKLKEELDGSEKHEELKNLPKYENYKELENIIKYEENDEIVIVKDTKLGEQTDADNTIELIEIHDDENLTEETEGEIKKCLNLNNEIKALPTNQELPEKATIKEEIVEENTKNLSKKICNKKNKKCKKDKKKESQKTKHRRCNIM